MSCQDIIGIYMPQKEQRILDIRVKRTHHLLRQALMELMPEKGFQAITVQDIADRAMINRGTFYEHFADKYALLEYSLRDLFRQTLSGRLPEEIGFSNENLRVLITTTCEFLSQLRRRCLPRDQQLLPVVQTQITTVINDILHTWLKGALLEQLPHQTSPDLAAAIISWAVYGAAFYWSQEDRQEPPDEFALRVLPLITLSWGTVKTNQ